MWTLCRNVSSLCHDTAITNSIYIVVVWGECENASSSFSGAIPFTLCLGQMPTRDPNCPRLLLGVVCCYPSPSNPREEALTNLSPEQHLLQVDDNLQWLWEWDCLHSYRTISYMFYLALNLKLTTSNLSRGSQTRHRPRPGPVTAICILLPFIVMLLICFQVAVIKKETSLNVKMKK